MFNENHSPSDEFLPLKILLAEDNSSVRRLIEIFLERADYQVLTAEDGLAAMKISQETRVDAVVADAVMPHLTGFDLCRILRQNPNYQDVPFILLSGLEKEGELHQADAFLVKDNDVKEKLLQTLSSLLARSKELQPN